MKYDWEEIDELLVKFSTVKVNVEFPPAVGGDWELFSGYQGEDYQVYFKCDELSVVNMAVVGKPQFLFSLTAEDKETVKKDVKFSFLFFAATSDIQNIFGELPKKVRQKVAKRAQELFY